MKIIALVLRVTAPMHDFRRIAEAKEILDTAADKLAGIPGVNVEPLEIVNTRVTTAPAPVLPLDPPPAAAPVNLATVLGDDPKPVEAAPSPESEPTPEPVVAEPAALAKHKRSAS